MTIETLLEKGFYGPFDLARQEAVQDLHDRFSLLNDNLKDRHIDVEEISSIFSDKNLLDKVLEAFGDNLLIWRSNFFVKQKESGFIEWHHDRHFENAEYPIDFKNFSNHFSILIAISDMTEKEGIMEFIPGSHRHIDGLERDTRPYHLRPLEEHFVNLPEKVLRQRVQVSLKAGQFLLFHSGLLHRSLPYRSVGKRISMIGRLAKSGTTIPLALAKPEVIVPFN